MQKIVNIILILIPFFLFSCASTPISEYDSKRYFDDQNFVTYDGYIYNKTDKNIILEGLCYYNKFVPYDSKNYWDQFKTENINGLFGAYLCDTAHYTLEKVITLYPGERISISTLKNDFQWYENKGYLYVRLVGNIISAKFEQGGIKITDYDPNPNLDNLDLPCIVIDDLEHFNVDGYNIFELRETFLVYAKEKYIPGKGVGLSKNGSDNDYYLMPKLEQYSGIANWFAITFQTDWTDEICEFELYRDSYSNLITIRDVKGFNKTTFEALTKKDKDIEDKDSYIYFRGEKLVKVNQNIKGVLPLTYNNQAPFSKEYYYHYSIEANKNIGEILQLISPTEMLYAISPDFDSTKYDYIHLTCSAPINYTNYEDSGFIYRFIGIYNGEYSYKDMRGFTRTIPSFTIIWN